MLSIAAPEKFVLTLQSVPPFLVESLLAFALAVLLAVPLIARIQHLLGSREEPKPTSIDASKRSGDHQIIVQYPPAAFGSSRTLHQIRPSTALSSYRQSLETVASEDAARGNDSATPTVAKGSFNYDHYRYELIKNTLKKQYGERQAPGDLVLNALHLSSIDSAAGIKLNEKYKHSLFDCFEKPTADASQQVSAIICHRDHFTSKETHQKPETVERATETVDPLNEVDKAPEEEEARSAAPRGPGRRPRSRKLSEVSKPINEPVEAITRPVTPSYIGRPPSRPGSPSAIPLAKQRPRMPFMDNIPAVQRKQSLPGPEDNSSLDPSEAFSASASRMPEKRAMQSRPTSSGAAKPYRNLMAKVNSRPRSSGGSFAWEVPNVSGNIWHHELPPQRATTPSRPKTPQAISRKKSEGVLSVLESILDLAYYGSSSPPDIRALNEEHIDNYRVQKNSRRSPDRSKRSKPAKAQLDEADDKRSFLRSRSGRYAALKVNREKRDD